MSKSSNSDIAALKRTPLYAAHVALGARMVPFAGYEMPVQYPLGILAEHEWTRVRAGLFDISHMGQAVVVAEDGRHETVAAALETLVPADMLSLKPGQQRYSQLLNASGGVIDDLMVTRPADQNETGSLYLVLNASRKEIDVAHVAQHLASAVRLEPKPDLALLGLQGPKAGAVMETLSPECAGLAFMQATRARFADFDCHVSRSGYSGEDGFEISVQADDAPALWRRLLEYDDVRPCGLGARDSLRLEAGLCLYGHELDETTSPIEAGLAWSIQKRRRQDGGFIGADRVLRELANGVARLRVGILPDSRAPARDGAEILSPAGAKIGVVTSGGFSPTLKRPIAMGYVAPQYASPGTRLQLIVRGASLDASVIKLPFVAHAYRRSS